MRSEMIVRNGEGLANLKMAEAILERFPVGEIIIDERLMTRSVCDMARFVGNGAGCRIKARSQSVRMVSRFQGYAYDVKQELQLLVQSFERGKSHPNPSADGYILAITRLPAHLSDVLPVAHELRDKHSVETLFGVIDAGMKERIANEGFPVIHLLALSKKRKPLLAAFIKRTLADMQTLLRRPLVDPACQFNSLERDALRYVTQDVLKSNLNHLVHVASGIEELIVANRPSLIFASNPYTLEGRVAIKVARAHRIPTASVEHGTIYPEDPIWEECGLDLMCAWGEPSRRALLSCGLRDEQIAVTGAPRFDKVGEALSRLPAAATYPAQPNVLVATSGAGNKVSLEQHQLFIRDLYVAANKTPEILWVVKLHTKDRPELYAEIQSHFPHARVEVVACERRKFGPDIFSFLGSAKALVTVSSSSALDAMLVGVPVVAVSVNSFTNGSKGLEFLERGCTVKVHDAQELADAVRRICNGKVDLQSEIAAKEYVAEHYSNLGLATEKVAEQLLAVMKTALSAVVSC